MQKKFVKINLQYFDTRYTRATDWTRVRQLVVDGFFCYLSLRNRLQLRQSCMTDRALPQNLSTQRPHASDSE